MFKNRINYKGWATVVVACTVGAAAGLSSMVVSAASPIATQQDTSSTVDAVPNEPMAEPGVKHHKVDRSGRTQVGKASFYASRYGGRKMADGTPMQLHSNNAASLTLPLGTTATVKNLQNGKSALITIRDRGPYVKGRIVDLSPATARSIGLTPKQGVIDVEVTPLVIPGSSS
jgi:rare lipoprotein A